MELPNHLLLTARNKYTTRKQFALPLQLYGGPLLIFCFGWLMLAKGDKTAGQLIVAIVGALAGTLMVVSGAKMSEPLRWLCPKCRARIHANEPWRCGFCKNEHPIVGKRPKYSFLDHCGNPNCKAEQTAFECPDCRTVMSLARKPEEGRYATSLNALPDPRGRTDEELRLQRVRELEEREHNRRHLEADKRQYELEIENARLKLILNRPEPTVVDPRQARINAAIKDMDDILHDCDTVAQSLVRQREHDARVDAMDFDEKTKDKLKDLAGRKFDQFRFQRGDEMSLHEKDHQ